jgi:hypothetical protein
MNDLNTINRLNAEAFADSIHRHRAAGRHVLARYEGLHLVCIETFSDGKAAQHAHELAATASTAGERTVLYAPTGFPAAAPVPTRDQSEDRRQPFSLDELATLGRSTTKSDATLGDNVTRRPDVTLTDYIARRQSPVADIGTDGQGCDRN